MLGLFGAALECAWLHAPLQQHEIIPWIACTPLCAIYSMHASAPALPQCSLLCLLEITCRQHINANTVMIVSNVVLHVPKQKKLNFMFV